MLLTDTDLKHLLDNSVPSMQMRWLQMFDASILFSDNYDRINIKCKYNKIR